jgi:DNA-3-methyladenine glycosylase
VKRKASHAASLPAALISGGTTPVGDPRNVKPLPRSFFNRDPRIVGRELLGKLLVRRHGQRILAGRIVETEAYLGAEDLAAHAAAGRTARNSVLFGPPGFAYVYFIYGTHFCLNVSCLPDGTPGGILFRALEPVAGLAEMSRFRHIALPAEPRVTHLKQLTSGPGRLAQAFAITRLRDNGKDLTSLQESDLWIADDDHQIARVLETPRIGISKSVEHPLRYLVAGNPFVSGKAIRD